MGVRPPPKGGPVCEVKSLIKEDYTLFKKGKTRDVYDLGERLLIEASDRISAFDVVFPFEIDGKGEALTDLSCFWFQKTKKVFPNHFIRQHNLRSILVTKAERIDIEWVVRSYLYGSAWRAYQKGSREVSGVKLPDGLQMAEKLPQPILTPTTKEDKGHDLEISKEEAIRRGSVTKNEWNVLEEASLKLFGSYSRHADSMGIIIPDFKLEFGRTKDGLFQIDEPPTHDSARFWPKKYYEAGNEQTNCLDKEYFRSWLMAHGFKGDGPIPEVPEEVRKEISKRCRLAKDVISGKVGIEKTGI